MGKITGFKSNKQYTQPELKKVRKDELTQLSKKMVSYVLTSTINQEGMTSVKKLHAAAQWLQTDTGIVVQSLKDAAKAANWSQVFKMQEVSILSEKERMYLTSQIQNEVEEQIKTWATIDAAMLQVADIEESTDEHFGFLVDEVGKKLGEIDKVSATKGNPAIIGIIAGYCPEMSKLRKEAFANSLEAAFITNQKLKRQNIADV